MNTWPNWVDLILVIIVFRTCYSGYIHGLFTELLTLFGAVSATCLTVNYASVLASMVKGWSVLPPHLIEAAVFWVFFLIVVFLVRLIVKRVTSLLKWERVHWLIQGVGLCLGGVRGLWWAGFIAIVFASSQLSFLTHSVESSVVGPQLVNLSRTGLEQVTGYFPGAEYRGQALVPPFAPPTNQ